MTHTENNHAPSRAQGTAEIAAALAIIHRIPKEPLPLLIIPDGASRFRNVTKPRTRKPSETRIIRAALAAGHAVTLPSGVIIRPSNDAADLNEWDEALKRRRERDGLH